MIPIGKAARRLGVTVHTLQKWDRDGKLIAFRSITNQRYYTEEQIVSAQGLSNSQQKSQSVAEDQNATGE